MPVKKLKSNFMKRNSIRTRSAFELGAHEQGAHVTYPGSDDAAARAGW
jgi:ornithine carbamoyltransferase